jgi:hypothetical protein
MPVRYYNQNCVWIHHSILSLPTHFVEFLSNFTKHEIEIRTANVHWQIRLHITGKYKPTEETQVMVLITNVPTAPIQITHYLQGEPDTLQTTFCNNGYSSKEIPHALHPPQQTTSLRKHHTIIASMPSIQNTFNCICRVLLRRNLKMVGLPYKKIYRLYCHVKHNLCLNLSGI